MKRRVVQRADVAKRSRVAPPTAKSVAEPPKASLAPAPAPAPPAMPAAAAAASPTRAPVAAEPSSLHFHAVAAHAALSARRARRLGGGAFLNTSAFADESRVYDLFLRAVCQLQAGYRRRHAAAVRAHATALYARPPPPRAPATPEAPKRAHPRFVLDVFRSE